MYKGKSFTSEESSIYFAILTYEDYKVFDNFER